MFVGISCCFDFVFCFGLFAWLHICFSVVLVARAPGDGLSGCWISSAMRHPLGERGELVYHGARPCRLNEWMNGPGARAILSLLLPFEALETERPSTPKRQE